MKLHASILVVMSLGACTGGEGSQAEGDLPEIDERFPEIPQPGGHQNHVVDPCFSISLPVNMERMEVQGIDSSVARFESESLRVSSDCGAYDTDWGSPAIAEQSVTIEGFDGTLSEYAYDWIREDRTIHHGLVLHLTKESSSEIFDTTHLNIAVYYEDQGDLSLALTILASVHDVWP